MKKCSQKGRRCNVFLDYNAEEEALNKYNAYMKLCEAAGLQMLINGTEKEYKIENGILYHICECSGSENTDEGKKVYSKNPREVMLFENLLAVKGIL